MCTHRHHYHQHVTPFVTMVQNHISLQDNSRSYNLPTDRKCDETAVQLGVTISNQITTLRPKHVKGNQKFHTK